MTTVRCRECGAEAPKWMGRCEQCGGWGTLEGPARGAQAPEPVALAMVDAAPASCRPSGIGELDRVLGGGVVPGSVTLLGGEPGIGKSTLALQALTSMAAAGATCLLVSAEESAAQVRLRAARLGDVPGGVLVLADTSMTSIRRALADARPDVCVVDSIQTVCDADASGAAGTVSQVTACASALTRLAKEEGTAVVLVGHVTKEGALAGPRALEHLVDTVLGFEGDRHHALRLLRATKHRFGPTGELGLFEMTESGLEGVTDPSGLFLNDRRRGAAGSAVVTTIEGRRPLLVEVQALVGRQGTPGPRRLVQGLDGGRVALLVALLDRVLGLPVAGCDVFVSAVGGVRITEPAADLGIALAIVSAVTQRPLPPDLVAMGEIGLGGEVRQVAQAARRLAEAARLGFGRALVPPAGPLPSGAVPVRTLQEAVLAAGVAPGPDRVAPGPDRVAPRPDRVAPGAERRRGRGPVGDGVAPLRYGAARLRPVVGNGGPVRPAAEGVP